jgi:hypothetical protein
LLGRDNKTVLQTVVPTEPTGNRVSAAALIFLSSGLLLVVLLSTVLRTNPAVALPSFAIQTGQPCAACHIGAFGPQLTPYGRDFKLHGYVASDGRDHGLPLAWTAMASFTHTLEPQPGGAAPGFKPNDNIALDETSLYWAGRITPEVGGFIEFMFDGVSQQPQFGNVDIRRASEGELFDRDVLWGITINNSPTVQDPWNSTPVWGFPYNRSPLAPTPMAATLVDGGLAQRAAGAGAYVLWNELLYLESDVYKGLDTGALRAVGQVPVDDGDQTTAFMPYARVALIEDWKNDHLEIGAYGISANILPGGNQTFGLFNRVTDAALDATYQFISDPTKVTSDRLSAHATYIHEIARMEASSAETLTGMLLDHSLDTVRLDVSYSFAATVTPSVQYFRSTGSADINYWSTPNGSPNSDGMIFEVAYVPWGKPDSPFPNVNFRLAVQYVNYFRFDGSSIGARNNNNVFFSLWSAVKF